MIREIIGNILALASILNVAEAVNLGREKGFESIGDDISAFQWSALMDRRTCPICKSLDGSYFEPGDPALDRIKPPIHVSCRCILVAVLKEETENFGVRYTYLSPAQVDSILVNKI